MPTMYNVDQNEDGQCSLVFEREPDPTWRQNRKFSANISKAAPQRRRKCGESIFCHFHSPSRAHSAAALRLRNPVPSWINEMAILASNGHLTRESCSALRIERVQGLSRENAGHLVSGIFSVEFTWRL